MNLPQNKAFCDTSFFFASLCPEDSNYGRAGKILESFRENKSSLYCTWDIISETVTLLRYRASYNLSIKFLDTVKSALHIVHYNDSVRMAAEEIFKKLSKDKKLSFCDAISYVVITHILENMPCFSFDGDFRSLGLIVYP